MSTHANSYQKRGVTTANIARLPAHIRDAVTDSVVMRPGEVHCRAVVPASKGSTTPQARVFTTVEKQQNRPKALVFSVLNHTGQSELTRVEVPDEHIAALVLHLVGIYKRECGQLSDLVAAFEQQQKETQDE